MASMKDCCGTPGDSSPQEAETPSVMSGTARKKILLVEDEAVATLIVTELLKRNGYEVANVSSGETAVEATRTDPSIDLVLMDINLGEGIDGTEAAKRILEVRGLPIVFLTSHAEQDMVEKVRGITRYGYVIKNSGNFVLLSSIEMAFELCEAIGNVERKNEELIETNRKLRESEVLLNETGKMAKVGGWEFDIATMEQAWTEEIYRIHEVDLTHRPTVSKGIDFYAPAARPVIERAVQSAIELGEPFDVELDFITAKGNHRRVHAIGKADRERGKVFGTFQDITEYRQVEETLRQKVRDLGERVKELNCLYGVAKVIAESGTSIDEVCIKAVHLIPPGWYSPENTCARITFEGREFSTDNFRETPWKLSAGITASGKHAGSVEVFLLEKEPSESIGLFLDEERTLLDYVAKILGTMVERRLAEEALQKIEWMLTKNAQPRALRIQSGRLANADVIRLNTGRLILDSVGEAALSEIADDYLDLLESCAAIYEKNGDYAYGIFTSEWCKFMDEAGRNLCGTRDDREALASGKWLCHESCWNEASRASVESGRPVDIACKGGIHIYAVPICADNGVIGSINFGYGTPPQDLQKINELASLYGVNAEKLLEMAKTYQPRPSYIIDIAKKRLESSARLIGEIVERTRAEEKIKSLLSEKELLLREVHHRIKNNMCTLMNLLTLQSNTLRDPSAVSSLEDARSRVQSMMVLYDKLYMAPDYRKISTKEYFTALIDEITGMFPGKGFVAIEKHIEDLTLDANTLSPLGIILNELLTNAMKYAFTGRDKGAISVSLSLKGTHATLIIEDDGVGIPESVDISASTGFGLMLVGMLAEQLRGTIRLEHHRGTKFTLEFDGE
ncbi:MAG: histidine kinase dimerization/phosphoacceptor domain -containing protein [Candidatus Eremiobacteraeota bacterium]|nr:histidine kinase dimerization/phosphoacceptor domain -containing protein [Candidatus Eremiobacteraeota bacterium]